MATNTIFNTAESLEVVSGLSSEEEKLSYLESLGMDNLKLIAKELELNGNLPNSKQRAAVKILDKLDTMPKQPKPLEVTEQPEIQLQPKKLESEQETTTQPIENTVTSADTNGAVINITSEASSTDITSSEVQPEETEVPQLSLTITQPTSENTAILDNPELDAKAEELLSMLSRTPNTEARLKIMQLTGDEKSVQHLARITQFIHSTDTLDVTLYHEFDEYLIVNQIYDEQAEKIKEQERISEEQHKKEALVKAEERKIELATSTQQSKLYKKTVEERSALLSLTVANRQPVFTASYPLSDGKKFVKYAYKSIANGLEISAFIRGKVVPILRTFVKKDKDLYKIETVLDEKNGNLAVSNNPEVTVSWQNKEYSTHSEFILQYLITGDIANRAINDSYQNPNSVKPFAFFFSKLIDSLQQEIIVNNKEDAALGGIMQSEQTLDGFTPDDFWTIKTICLATYWLRAETHNLPKFREELKTEYLAIPEQYRLVAQNSLGLSLDLEDEEQRFKRLESVMERHADNIINVTASAVNN